MKLRLVIIFSTILIALGALTMFTGRGKAGTLVIADVYDVVTKPADFRNRELRIRGHIKPGSVLRYGEKADFILEFKGKEIQVRFDGSSQLPDTFADGAPARADGRLNAKGELISNRVEAKCASKYDAKHAADGKKADFSKYPKINPKINPNSNPGTNPKGNPAGKNYNKKDKKSSGSGY